MLGVSISDLRVSTVWFSAREHQVHGQLTDQRQDRSISDVMSVS